MSIVRYNLTGMSMDISKIESDPQRRKWTKDTIYHNINIILNRWHEPESKEITIGVFRSANNFGPNDQDEGNVDIWLHPFTWKNQWHLVVGINPYNKIILINCSKDQKKGFPIETCIEFEQFITFFKSKITKEALQHPKLCNDLLDPADEDNGVNLLTIILTFCLRPDTLIKLFCDPTTTPRQFDVSDLIPYVINADINFRKSNPPLLTAHPPRTNGNGNGIVKTTQKKKHESKIKKDVTSKESVKKSVKGEIKKESSGESKSESDKHGIRRSSTEVSGKLPPAKRLRGNDGSFEQPIDLDELEDDESDAEQEGKEIQRVKQEEDRLRRMEERSKQKSVKKEEKRKREREKEREKTDEKETSVLEEAGKSDSTSKTSIDLKNEDNNNNDNSNDNDHHSKNINATTNTTTNISTTTTTTTLNKVMDLKSLFKRRLPHSFSRILQMNSFREGKKEIDIILEGIENWTHSKLTNSRIQVDEIDFKSWGLLIRENLLVEFTRKTKREFDEEELDELLEIDHKNEIFPLFFENNTIFLVNFHTKDGFKTIVNIIVISTRPRGEKEIMKNYAFKRLVELYVWKYHRLVTKIRTSVITVTDGTSYEVFMVTLYCVHRFVMHSRFDIKFSPNMEQVESYMDNFERLMQAIKIGDELKRNLAYKKIVKCIT